MKHPLLIGIFLCDWRSKFDTTEPKFPWITVAIVLIHVTDGLKSETTDDDYLFVTISDFLLQGKLVFV